MEKNKPNLVNSIYKKLFNKNKVIKQVLLWYLFISIFGAIILWIPFMQKGESNMSFIDSLFISSSAFSDTGLSTVAIGDTYNILGQFVIMLLIIIGGIGFFTIRVFVIHFIFMKKVDNEDKTQASQEVSSESVNKSFEIIKVSLITMFASIVIFGLIFGILFATIEAKPLNSDMDPGLQGNWLESFWVGMFHSTSSINNAGFDIFFGDYSMGGYYSNYVIQFLTIFLFIMGGVGFAIIYDIYNYFKNLSRGKKFKFSLFTKISSLSYLIVAILGLFLSFMSETTSYLINGSNSFFGNESLGTTWDKTWALTFNTFSTRNAGFSTFDLSELNSFTKVNYSIMMFIGSGPGSTAGGIRTTTFIVLILYLVSLIRKKDNVIIFNRKISENSIKMSIRILIFSLILVLLSSVFISIGEVWVNPSGSSNFIDILFLTSSAYGTTGLSSFSLGSINTFTKLLLIIVMFIGQFGAVNTLALSNLEVKNKKRIRKNKKIKANSHYITETIQL